MALRKSQSSNEHSKVAMAVSISAWIQLDLHKSWRLDFRFIFYVSLVFLLLFVYLFVSNYTFAFRMNWLNAWNVTQEVANGWENATQTLTHVIRWAANRKSHTNLFVEDFHPFSKQTKERKKKLYICWTIVLNATIHVESNASKSSMANRQAADNDCKTFLDRIKVANDLWMRLYDFYGRRLILQLFRMETGKQNDIGDKHPTKDALNIMK